jgi:hypothetical protein
MYTAYLQWRYLFTSLYGTFWFSAWRVWHTILPRHVYGITDYFHEGRPSHHMCCNGNAGGWRTSFCSYMEKKWVFADEFLHHIGEQIDERVSGK